MDTRQAAIETSRAATLSIVSNTTLTIFKLAAGFLTGSVSVLAEGIHSGNDLLASFLAWFAIRKANEPEDEEHQYGHGKVENFSAFVETGLLLLTCAWIIYEAVIRLFFRRVEIEPSGAAFAVMLFSMGVDWWRSRILGRIATKYDSQALEADALHFSTDIWSAGVVVFGLALVLAGRAYHIDWLRDSDPIAALVVAGVVVSVSWRLARRTIDALLDAAPPGVRSQIYDTVSRVNGVLEVDRVRIRRAGNRYFADVAVGLARTVTFQRSGQLAAAVTESVHRILPDADVTVQPLPRAQHTENIFDRIRAVATHRNLNVHDISVQELSGRLHVEQHVELDERMTLKEAHDQVTELEADIRAEAPQITDILTHIESEPATIEKPDRNGVVFACIEAEPRTAEPGACGSRE
jgi:cation diffusion facilitator family transporter